MSTATQTTALALKEWGAAVHALLQGTQTLLLRKGGIHEKAFRVAGDATSGRFVLFPTVAHSHAERVRAEHVALLERGAADVAADAFTVRCGVTIVDLVEVARPEALREIADLHIWTDASIREDRLEFRPRHALQALIVRAVELPEPFRVPRLPEHGGCKSWVQLPLAWDGSGRQIHDDARLAADAERVRATVG